ncbi:hypothetical protein BJ875DRAFT_201465 [Amylocarpus encephaloides]|uniref:Uncharacterized protein n=1 Tax=Amylocarpus encephaloides TaxID=45428 RepID=A0A9P7YNI3_9HELO|nr:hypothetical protein BJ875DRAFT_201465 [Amylocarpus encephaloides]
MRATTLNILSLSSLLTFSTAVAVSLSRQEPTVGGCVGPEYGNRIVNINLNTYQADTEVMFPFCISNDDKLVSVSTIPDSGGIDPDLLEVSLVLYDRNRFSCTFYNGKKEVRTSSFGGIYKAGGGHGGIYGKSKVTAVKCHCVRDGCV